MIFLSRKMVISKPNIFRYQLSILCRIMPSGFLSDAHKAQLSAVYLFNWTVTQQWNDCNSESMLASLGCVAFVLAVYPLPNPLLRYVIFFSTFLNKPKRKCWSLNLLRRKSTTSIFRHGFQRRKKNRIGLLSFFLCQDKNAFVGGLRKSWSRLPKW